jgi:hypothetical protein
LKRNNYSVDKTLQEEDEACQCLTRFSRDFFDLDVVERLRVVLCVIGQKMVGDASSAGAAGLE